MPRYVAFLRAINVGGHVVKMDRLKTLFEDLGVSNVRTFIASGNVIFESPSKATEALEKKIAAGLEKALGYDVAVFIRSINELAQIAEHKAYKDADVRDASLFVGLLEKPLGVRDQKTVESLQSPVDDLHVNKREIYWLARSHFRDAKFSPAKMEKLLGQQATFRNVKTIRRLAALCSTAEGPHKKR